jgi:hypothetical protein
MTGITSATLPLPRPSADLEHAINRVTDAPERCPFYHGPTRRYIFQRFPVSLMYRVTAEAIEVIAVAHYRRIPHEPDFDFLHGFSGQFSTLNSF